MHLGGSCRIPNQLVESCTVDSGLCVAGLLTSASPPAAVDTLATGQSVWQVLRNIVARAEKPESNVKSVPIRITATTVADIERSCFTSLTVVIQAVPRVSMRNATSGQTQLQMRGLASSSGQSATLG